MKKLFSLTLSALLALSLLAGCSDKIRQDNLPINLKPDITT